MIATAPAVVRVRRLESEFGTFYVAMRDGALVECGWSAMRSALPDEWRDDARLAPDLVARIRAALKGEAVDFRDVAIPDAGPFFLRCRRAVQSVAAGETVTYAELARRAGSPAAVRAAGQAMRRNPTPIVVPCHRVVARNGLGGFAGVEGPSRQCSVKAALLELERGRRGRA
jgi:methylated-DNA-[protein]-cysteine S-methyltransferase